LNRLLSKVCTLIIYLLHPATKSEYRYFQRFYYQSKLFELRHYVKDFVIKKPYKEIRFYGEFQQELLFAIPYAYWHFKNGTLASTTSSYYTNELYFFSPNHKEQFRNRRWLGNFVKDIPNAPHNHKLNNSKWMRVPYKDIFKNDHFLFDKPALVIANRYNKEWNSDPISYLSIDILRFLFDKLLPKYKIIYNRPDSNNIVEDNSEILNLDEKDWIRDSFPDVVIMDDLFQDYRSLVNNYNHFQLMVYSNCSRFISVHGGTAALASYFGGKNVIFSKLGHEHYFDEFQHTFTKLSGARIVVCRNEDQLKESIILDF